MPSSRGHSTQGLNPDLQIELEIVILSEVRQRKINITLIAYMWSLKEGYK